MNCIVIDRNKETRSLITRFIKQTPSLRLLKSCSTADDAVHTLMNNEVELVFLDVKMSGMNDIDFIKNVDYNHSQLIIIASTRKFAKEAFDFNATDYLMTPVTRDRFLRSVAKAKRMNSVTKVGTHPDEVLFVKQDGVYIKVRLDDIFYIKAMGDYVTLHTADKKYLVKQTLKHVLGKLPAHQFLRTHLSYIVNLEKVKVVDDRLVLTNDQNIPMSRTYKAGVMKRINVL